MSYWDSSALAKLYLKEPDSVAFLSLAKRAVPLRTSPLGQYEVTLTFRRQEADGALDRQTTNTLADELLIDIASGLVELVATKFELHAEFQHVLQTCFERAQPISIRTLDALHLAAALSASEAEFISNDIRQRTAAQALGMTVLP